MALTLEAYNALDDASLLKLFDKYKDLWKAQAKKAYDYMKDSAEPNPIRVDDVVEILEPILKITDTLTDYLGERKLREKYWTRRFGDLILDRCWNDLTTGGKKA